MKSIKLPLGLLTIPFLLIISACSKEEEGLKISDNVNTIKIYDLGNEHNASDIFVKFQVNITSGEITEYWVMILKENSSVPDVTTLGDNHYHRAVFTPEEDKAIRLGQSQTDADGNAIEINTNYFIQVYTPENDQLSNPSDVFTLENVSPLSGRYVGTWNDNLFQDIGISVEITQIGNNFSCIWYNTPSFTSFGGGDNDGTAVFTVEDDIVTRFRYNQDLPNYMGGCPGLYEGTGEKTGPFSFRFDFTGDDCDGHHEDGVITLTLKR